MTPRKFSGGSRGPRTSRRGRSPKRVSGGGGKKSSCSMAIPSMAFGMALAALVAWNLRMTTSDVVWSRSRSGAS